MTRTTRLLVLLTALLGLLGLLGLAGGPASADADSRTDPAGDAPSQVDITRFTVGNGARRIVMVAEVPGLAGRGGFTFQYSRARFGGLYISVKRAGPGPDVEVEYCGEIRCRDTVCRGLRTRWSVEAHQVAVSVPHRCYLEEEPEVGVFSVGGATKDDYDSVRALRVRRL